MRQIINFRNIKELADITFSSDKQLFVITATEDLGKTIKSNYKLNARTIITGAGSFVDAFIPKWENTIKDIKNYVRIRSVVEDYIYNNSSINAETASYLRRNTAEMWNAIVLLIEADVYPDDIDDKPNYIGHFKKIWKEIEKYNNQICEFRSDFKFTLTNQTKLKNKLSSLGLGAEQTIYFIGFYFITPIQERIIEIIENAGIKIVFLNCKNDTNKECAYMNEIWNITFSGDNYSDKNNYAKSSLKNVYGEALKDPSTKIPCSVTKHSNVFDFASMVKKAYDNGELIYSPNSKISEKYLREFYPEHFKDKHLLSYPVGQYIYYLHMMWDSFDNKLSFDFDYVYQCLASGWLMTDEYNGKNYLHDFSLLNPYFEKCKDLDQWISNIKSLKDAKVIANIFEDDNTKSNRWHKLLGQPLNKIGVHTIPLESIEALEVLFYKLVEDANILFSKTGKVDLYEHFSKVKNIIENKITLDKDKILSEEAEIITELIKKLSDKSVQNIECPLSGIKDAMLLLINGQESNQSSFNERIQVNNHMVFPIETIESAMVDKSVKKVHLVLADEFSLPGAPTELPWPLDNNIIEKIIDNVSNKRRKYVETLRSIVVNAPVSNRYLFFTFMGIEKAELNIEWISKKDNREIDVSPFVSLFKFNEGQEKVEENKQHKINSIDKFSKFNLEPAAPDEVPDDVLMDYLLCKNRFIYSYVLNEYPSFYTDFHYSFLLTKLISAFLVVSEISKIDIAQEINKLFPFFRNVELKQSLDFATTNLKAKIPPICYNNVEYPGARLLIHYLDNELINYCEGAIESIYSGAGIGPAPEKKCIYCPYSNVCMSKYDKEDDVDE